MKPRKSAALLLFIGVAYLSGASDRDAWEIVGNIGVYGLVGTAAAVPVYTGDWEGLKQAIFSVASASAAGLAGKAVIDAERPDGSGHDSFPSNHTANAFAAATMLTLRYGREFALPAYGIAALTGVARVEADKHYWKDVAAGAAIGLIAGWIFTRSFSENIHIAGWAGMRRAGITVSIQD